MYNTTEEKFLEQEMIDTHRYGPIVSNGKTTKNTIRKLYDNYISYTRLNNVKTHTRLQWNYVR